MRQHDDVHTVSDEKQLSLDEFNKLKSHSEMGGLESVPLLQKKINDLSNTELNIAVTGKSGAGKSTFINKGAAKTGMIETTMEPIGYTHPRLLHVILWDLPGIGSDEFLRNKYVREMKFKRFDFFIIISACRFSD
ncbi:hypothetical protein chiPu_0019685 [Chiloscyllium punctatum]|uniref:IRG-type G domain-containing protein n=1 Tax=Chiloscyllium punctatum TaxID=137246 RepID=A0A401RSW5_CHIPU|nr:hypothetical protein [Chiloscyllium punctatum]